MPVQTAIKIRRSSVASKIPLTTDLVLGELALNTYDGVLYFKKSPGGTDSIVAVVTLDGTQTLTNKTLSSAVLTGTLTANGSVGTNGQILQSTGTGVQWVTSSAGSSGTVTSVSVVSANGFAGTVATNTTTPAITISTSITGLLKGNGTAISAATSGTDYAPGTSALVTGILKSTTSTGALTIASAGTDYIAPYGSTTANFVLAAPNGSAGTPAFRALVAADIPALSYAPTAGSASITTLGTISTGTWNGSAIAGQYGGTGVANTGKTITLGGNLTTSGAFTTTLTATANTSVTLPTTGTLATTGNLSQFAATTSAQLAGVISDETGSGALVFGTSPTLTTPSITTSATFNGATSGTTVVQATATASGTLTFPNGNDVLVGRATTDTLTNKTLSSAVITGTVTAGGAVGTAGQVLSSTGTGVQWVAPSAGGGLSVDESIIYSMIF